MATDTTPTYPITISKEEAQALVATGEWVYHYSYIGGRGDVAHVLPVLANGVRDNKRPTYRADSISNNSFSRPRLFWVANDAKISTSLKVEEEAQTLCNALNRALTDGEQPYDLIELI